MLLLESKLWKKSLFLFAWPSLSKDWMGTHEFHSCMILLQRPPAERDFSHKGESRGLK